MKTRLFVISTLVAVALPLSSAAAQQSRPLTISGTVTDAATGAPLAGAIRATPGDLRSIRQVGNDRR